MDETIYVIFKVQYVTMDETIYVIFKVQFDFALEVWFSTCLIHVRTFI